MDNIIVNIDSRFRNKQVYPNSGKFVYNLSENIKNCKYVRLSSFEFPNLYFTFTKTKINTSFTIIKDLIRFEVVIEDGFYASDSLLTAIQTKLADANLTLGTNLTIEFNFNNGFVTIQNDSEFSLDFSNSTSRYPSLGYQLGYRSDKYNVNSSTVINGSFTYAATTESQLDAVIDSYLFLKINDYGVIYHDFEDILVKDYQGNIIERQKYIGNRNIFAKIIINANKAEYVFDGGSNFLTKSFIFRQPIDLNRLSIELSDSKGNIVDMVHMDYSFTLEIGVIYDLSLTYELTDSISNKFLLNGLPNLPGLEKLDKKNHNLNITNDLAHEDNDLTEYKIINKDNFKEETLTYDLETLNALFESIEDKDDDNTKEDFKNSKKEKNKVKDQEKEKDKKKKKKYNFNY
jgi:hypothetical protein